MNRTAGLGHPPGNMTQDPSGASPRFTYTYDADGNMTAAAQGGSTVATYFYDSANNRIRMNRPTWGTYEFVFDAANRRVSTWVPQGTSFVQSLIYSDSGPVAFRGGGYTNFEHYNWVGTKRLITSYNGSTVATITSLPFGDAQTITGADGDWSDFAGLEGDGESNSEHAQFRQYSMAQGRFFSPDPYTGSYDFSNPQSFNRYAYALNNPVSLIDPSGLDDCQATEGGYEGDCGDPQSGSDGQSGSTYGSDPGTDPGSSNSPTDPVNAGNPFTIQGPTTWQFIPCDLGACGYTPQGSFSGPGYQFFGAIPMGGVYGPVGGVGGGLGAAPNNCISPGVCKSKIDNMNLMEKGKTNYRDPLSICSTHTTVDNSTGATNSHVDLFNPGTSLPTMNGSIPLLPFHLLFDAIPDLFYNKTGFYPWPAGRTLCQ